APPAPRSAATYASAKDARTRTATSATRPAERRLRSQCPSKRRVLDHVPALRPTGQLVPLLAVQRPAGRLRARARVPHERGVLARQRVLREPTAPVWLDHDIVPALRLPVRHGRPRAPLLEEKRRLLRPATLAEVVRLTAMPDAAGTDRAGVA